MCRACERTYPNTYHVTLREHETVCKRVRSKARQWWEREPGYVRDEIAAELKRAGREWWPTVYTGFVSVYHREQDRELARAVAACSRELTPIRKMTPRQLVAELGRQSKRLAGQPSWDVAD